MRDIGAAAAIFGLSSNLRYLTGFTDEPGERLLCLIVGCADEPTFIVPELYAAEVRARTSGFVMRVWRDGETPEALLSGAAKGLSGVAGRILLDDTLWSTFALSIQRAFAGREFGLASEVMEGLRLRKDEQEVGVMQRAGEIADRAYEAVTSQKVAGLSEIELAGRLEAEMLAHGAEGVAFQTLVASGPNSAMPHHRAGARRIEAGDVVILDFGCRVAGYCSDVSRTVVCGDAPAEVERVYDAVRRSYVAARDASRVGTPAEAVDRAARDVLVKAGYGEQFVHRTGHGIGLDVHESPYLVEGSDERLEEGMTFSIEPGVYLPGRFGIRVEDVVVVTEEGERPMTHAPHELKRVA
ncbi:MAG: aminopeptidase P family protein [Candidatus Bipolaricaulota bacterium]|nr:MAG: aminopeptidase P family protein [Candidatus Bipolaricaulota bacterium]